MELCYAKQAWIDEQLRLATLQPLFNSRAGQTGTPCKHSMLTEQTIQAG